MQPCLLATFLVEIHMLLSFGWFKIKSFGNAIGHSNEPVEMEKLMVLLVIYQPEMHTPLFSGIWLVPF